MVDRFSLNLLGGFRLIAPGGESIPVSQRKGIGLLAYLGAANGHASTREALASLLWGQSEQRLARQSLRQVLGTLTRDLALRGADFLALDRQVVALLSERMHIDTVEIDELAAQGHRDALVRASKLYDGEFLAGLSIDSPDFEDWLRRSREKYRDIAVHVTVSLMEQCGTAGDMDEAVEAANRALHIDPFREDVHRYLMGIYAGRGMRAAALAQYQTCAATLQRELGVSPDEETAQLHETILARSAATRRAAMDNGRRNRATARVQQDAATKLIGVDRELNVLRRHVDRAEDTGARIVLVTGEAGAGKSALLAGLRQEFDHQGVPVAFAYARPAGQRMNFSLWLDLLMCPPLDLASEPDPSASIIRRLAFLRSGHAARGRGGQQPEPDSHHIFDAVADHLQSRARGAPLILAIEDLQYVDDASMRLLAYVLRKVRQSAVLVAMTLRPDDMAGRGELAKILDDLDRDRLIDRIPLRPLARADVETLVRTLRRGKGMPMVARERLKDVWLLSDGNPGIAVEMALEEGDHGSVARSADLPKSLTIELARRSEGLSEDARMIAVTASVMGEKPSYDLLARATGLSEDSIVRGAEALVAAGLFIARGNDFHFSRGRFRVAQYLSLLPARRRRLHLAVAAAIANGPIDDPVAHVTMLLHHYSAADCRAGALRCHLKLGRIYMRRGASDLARQSLLRALHIVHQAAGGATHRDGEVEARLGIVELDELAGQLGAALTTLRALGGMRQAYSSAELEARVLSCFGRLNGALGNDALAHTYVRRAAKAVEGKEDLLWQPPDRLLERIHLVCGSDSFRSAHLMEDRGNAEKYGFLTDKIELSAMLGLVCAARGHHDQAIVEAQAAVDTAIRLGDGRLLASGLHSRAIIRTWGGDTDKALDDFDKAGELAVVCGDAMRLYQVHVHRGHALARARRYPESVMELDLAWDMAAAMALGYARPLCRAWKAWALAEMGDPDAQAEAQSALMLAGSANRPWAHSVALRALALVLAHPDNGEFAGAQRAIRMAMTEQKTMGLEFERAPSLMVYARVLQLSGEPQRSTSVMELAQTLFRRMRTTIDRTAAHHLSNAPHVPQCAGR